MQRLLDHDRGAVRRAVLPFLAAFGEREDMREVGVEALHLAEVCDPRRDAGMGVLDAFDLVEHVLEILSGNGAGDGDAEQSVVRVCANVEWHGMAAGWFP